MTEVLAPYLNHTLLGQLIALHGAMRNPANYKVCGLCKIQKHRSEFYVRYLKSGEAAIPAYCMECMKTYRRGKYLAQRAKEAVSA